MLGRLPADQYLEAFLQPLTSLFTLYAPHALPLPVACITIDYGDCEHSVPLHLCLSNRTLLR